jgi:hypothetical protein
MATNTVTSPSPFCVRTKVVPLKFSPRTPCLEVVRPLNVRLPMLAALDHISSLLDTISATTELDVAYTLVTQARALTTAVENEIINPMSPFRAEEEAIALTRVLTVRTRVRMCCVLARDGYFKHRESIYDELRHIIVGCSTRLFKKTCDPELNQMFEIIQCAIQKEAKSLAQRTFELKTFMCLVPDEMHFIRVRFWFQIAVFRQEIEFISSCVRKKPIVEVRDALVVLKEMLTGLMRTVEVVQTPEAMEVFLPLPSWAPANYLSMAHGLAGQLDELRKEIETRWMLKQGDQLLDLATDRAKLLDPEYYKFQAMLAFDCYRSAQQVCATLDEINIELEGVCLWSMARVIGGYLGLHAQAHELYVRMVTMVGMNTSLLPNSSWYMDSAERIQWYRDKLIEEENASNARCNAATAGGLFFELMELQTRSENVTDGPSLRHFLQWLLRTHPPRTQSTSGILESRELCMVVVNVINVYSTKDTPRDLLWEVTCEEIVKVRSRHSGINGLDSQSVLRKFGRRLLILWGVRGTLNSFM